MAISTLQRPFFYEGQYLGATDLTAVVDYGRLADARHLLGAHTWGIAMGLQLIEKPLPGGSQMEVYIQPGYAWDGFGRPIVVLSPYKLPAELFRSIRYSAALDQSGAGRLIEIWLRYDEAAGASVRPGFEVCEQDSQFTRLQETFLVEIGPQDGIGDQRSSLLIDGRSMDAKQALRTFDPAAPIVYDTSVPHQSLPEADEPARWLIPIGLVRWQPVQNGVGFFVARDETSADKDSAKMRRFRHYIGVVAETIQAADGALRLRDRGKDPLTSNFQAPTDDLVWVEGNLRTEGDVRIAGGVLDFRSVTGEDFKAPLKIQRISDGLPDGVNALQIILGGPSRTNNRFAVGPLKAENTVDEKFVILSGGNVGIGTSTPITKLEIVGDWTGEEGNLRLTGDKPTIRFTRGDVAGNESWILHLGSNGPGNLEFFKRTGAQTWENILSLTPAGKIGMGTPAPRNRLGIRATGVSEELISFENPAGQTKWHINQNLQNTPGLNFVETDVLGGDGRLFIKAGGNVGIGTVNPVGRLTINGTQQPLQGTLSFFTANDDMVYDGGSDGLFIIRATNGGRTAFMGGNIGIGTENPRAKLEVQGQIRLGTNGDLFATGGMESLRLLRGTIQATGTIASGIGFTVTKAGTGLYDIFFNQVFLGRPSASVTQVFPDLDNFALGGNTRDNAVLVGINSSRMRIKTGNDDGDAEDRDFTFVVVGSP